MIDNNNKMKNNNNFNKYTIGFGVLLFAFFVGFISATYISFNIENKEPIISPGNTNIVEIDSESEIIHAIDKVFNAVLCISVYNDRGEVISTGTGFVYKKDKNFGYVVTNAHVISLSNRIEALLSNNEVVSLALLSSDEYADIAVLKMDAKSVLQTATLGSSKDMKVGNTVFTVGSPLGSNYAGTVTRGILAGKDRMVKIGATNYSSSDMIVKVLQTDAAINPGNSGGPLVNLLGEVIGINSLKLVDDNIEGMGFALPIEDTIKYIEKLENKEQIIRPALGVQILDLSNKYYLARKGYKINEELKYGILIDYIEKDYPAYNAGLKVGDIITKIDGILVKTVAEFRYELFKYNLGDIISITYITNNKENVVSIKLSRELK